MLFKLWVYTKILPLSSIVTTYHWMVVTENRCHFFIDRVGHFSGSTSPAKVKQ